MTDFDPKLPLGQVGIWSDGQVELGGGDVAETNRGLEGGD